jgi:signal transduction histidine kinase/CheY-like chemotaxis protein
VWHSLGRLPEAQAEFVTARTNLIQSTSRILILTIGAFYLGWHFVASDMWPTRLGSDVWPVTASIGLICALSLWLLPRHFLAAQVVWLAGFCGATAFALHVYQQPGIALLYALLPLMAVVTVGWSAGLCAEVGLVALVWWLSHAPGMPELFPSNAMIIILGGAITGILGWAAVHPLSIAIQWYLSSFQEARRHMEEARDQRVELKQTQEDLLLANRELARLSDRLEAMVQLAEEARRTKEEFVANVSHELRTPLNMVIGFSEMITRSPQVYSASLPPALLADVAAIERNSRHLAKLIDDVLDLSQVEAGRMALSKDWASLAEIVDAATTIVRAFFDSKGLYLHTDAAPDLPALFCDATRIRQVVLNLLSNAGRFTDQGGVTIRMWREGAEALVSVSDSGPGIAADQQRRLFEPFQQLDNSLRRIHGGSGLGLCISKRFVEMHGGRMWLESELGKGTTVSFALPLQTPAGPAASGGPMQWLSPYGEYARGLRRSKAPVAAPGARFVVVDEGGGLQRLFTRYLTGAEIVAVRDAGEAIRELGRTPATALVANLPPNTRDQRPFGPPGELPYGTPALTCWVAGEDEAARRLGADRYLVKPVTCETLLSTIESLGKDIRSVLIVDDEPEAVRLFSRMISSSARGYRVFRATNGRRALDLLRERRPDAILLDLVMPGMDGFQVLQERSKDPSLQAIPTIVISSQDPTGSPVVTDALTVARSGGLSARQLLTCVQAVSEILAP